MQFPHVFSIILVIKVKVHSTTWVQSLNPEDSRTKWVLSFHPTRVKRQQLWTQNLLTQPGSRAKKYFGEKNENFFRIHKSHISIQAHWIYQTAAANTFEVKWDGELSASRSRTPAHCSVVRVRSDFSNSVSAARPVEWRSDSLTSPERLKPH